MTGILAGTPTKLYSWKRIKNQKIKEIAVQVVALERDEQLRDKIKNIVFPQITGKIGINYETRYLLELSSWKGN